MPEKQEKKSLVPELTPELLEANEAEQKVLRENLSVPKDSAALRRQALIDADIEILKILLVQFEKAEGEKKEAILAQINRYQEELSETFASAGDFVLAHQFALDERQQTLYGDYIGAVRKSENDWCEHPRWTRENSRIEQIAYREFDFYSEQKGARLSMLRCRICGFRNAVMNLPSDLEKLSAHRREIVRATEGMKKADAVRKTREMAKKDITDILR